jgi:YfiH family protein
LIAFHDCKIWPIRDDESMTDHPHFLTHPWLNIPGIRHGFFTRHGGVSSGLYDSLNGGLGSKDDMSHVKENRNRAMEAIGGGKDTLCGLYQIHSNICRHASAESDDRPEGDALVAHELGLTCVILTADCVPVLFADPKNRIVAAAHAGWRGAVAGITTSTIDAMIKAGAERDHIIAVTGPAIQQDSYQVGDDLRDEVCATDAKASRFFKADDQPHHWRFDLPGFVTAQIKAIDVKADRMTEDTYSDDRFFSHRRACHAQHPDSGRLMSMIRLTDFSD